MTSPKAFAELIKSASYKDKNYTQLTPLTNVTFFLGAGFSKSWDKSFPTGNELFSFKIEDYSDELDEFIDNIGFLNIGKIDFSTFKDMAYHVSMQKKYPSIRSRYIDLYNLEMIENAINAVIARRFQDISMINYVKNPGEKLKLTTTPSTDQVNIVKFFSWLNDQTTGDNDIPEGMRPHFITTNYDFLVESIQDEILGGDDNQLLYAYRGFTPQKTNGVNRPRTVFKHWLVNSLIKLNGGFEIYKHNNHGFSIDYTAKTEKDLKANAPILIVPNREQDYTGEYFQAIFPKAIKLLQESRVLVIIGYSLPDEDALIRLLLRQFAEENVDGTEKMIFFIDLMDEKEQYRKLQTVFPYHQYQREWYHIYTYAGFFTNWVKEVLALI
ncbi:MAG TPA: hypothetical protein VNS58_09120 [Puia sp.]|nr:hypothetical protein [Puia sp.]